MSSDGPRSAFERVDDQTADLFARNGILLLNDGDHRNSVPRWLFELRYHAFGYRSTPPASFVDRLERLKILHFASWMPDVCESVWRLGGNAALFDFLLRESTEPCTLLGRPWEKVVLPGYGSVDEQGDSWWTDAQQYGRALARLPATCALPAQASALATGQHPTATTVLLPARSVSCVGIET